MRTGMLWFDDTKSRTLEERLTRAVAHYERKYGDSPTLCYVHPSELDSPGETLNVMGIEVRTANSILPHHLWIGKGEARRQKSAA